MDFQQMPFGKGWLSPKVGVFARRPHGHDNFGSNPKEMMGSDKSMFPLL